MTEADWLTCADPEPMLEYLRGRISDRKVHLFAVACCRRAWSFLSDERCCRAVEVAERFADGGADVKELAAVRTATLAAERGPADRAAYWTAHPNPSETIWNVHTGCAEAEMANALLGVSPREHEAAWNAAGRVANQAQAELLREIVGNPFRPVVVDPRWLAWSGATVRRIARGIYEEGRFDHLPILADALEDAGCDNADLLIHCRDEGHVRGCWAVDLLLGQS